MWNTLRGIGFPEHLIALLGNLFSGQKAVVLSKYYSGVQPSKRLREIFILEYSCTFA